MDMIQDWMIINKIKMGDPDAWDILVHKYYDSVYFYCVRRCYGDCDIASDLTQDIFLKLVESLPRYRFIGKFQNYLYTMAVNTCNNYLKKRHIEQIELTDNFTTDLDTSLIDEILHDERKETVQKALDLLPEIQREVVILRYYHDLKVNRAYVFINKESQRIRKESLNALDGKDVLLVFPTNHKKNSTVRILKTPKTESSVRKIFLPKSVANMLVDWKVEQDEMKEILGDEYMDYNLVMASTFGLPLGDGAIRGPLKKLIEDYNLPPVVFHSFRHSSVTYKLKLNGGDIKAVQGDSGHAQVNMVTDVYSHILDDDRRKNAELFEEAFYEKKNLDPQMHVQQENNNATVADEVDPELLAKVLANPEMRALLNSLAKTMK